jgi:tetratricopeptide (TPR) repeat protein
MVARRTTSRWLQALVVVTLTVTAGSCCFRPDGVFARRGRRDSVVVTMRAPSQPMSLDPSPLLQMVREERIAMTGPLVRSPRGGNAELAPRWQAPSREDALAQEQADAALEDQAIDHDTEAVPDSYDDAVEAEGVVRHVWVPKRRFATHEDLVRGALRNAESRNPRALYVNRMLLRFAGPVCDCDGDVAERARVRELMTALVKRARPAMKRCLGIEMAEDPRVFVKAPSLLIVAQAMRLGSLVYRLMPSFDVGPHGVVLRGLGWRGEGLTAELEHCLETALQEASPGAPTTFEVTHDVVVPLVAFSQQGWGMNLGNPHGLLAMHAAVLGWLHYERGEYEHALEFFKDASWTFRLEEFKYLEAMALEQLGDRQRAAKGYEIYLAARPYAPEAAELPALIDRLRGPAMRHDRAAAQMP